MCHEGKFVFFYNLGYDADCILKLLPVEILRRYKKDKKLTFHYNGYTISYVPRKQLKISKGKHTVSCYDIAQYYDNASLEKAYLDNIPNAQLDKEYLAMKQNREHFTLRYYLRTKKAIRNYCIKDCTMTKELAQNWINTFTRQFHFIPRN